MDGEEQTNNLNAYGRACVNTDNTDNESATHRSYEVQLFSWMYKAERWKGRGIL